jgi:nucleotide-binding universal stress UspA family protein
MDAKFNEIVLVPTDFSDVCLNAVRHGAEIAKHFNYTLAVLHIIDKESRSQLKKENLGEDALSDRLGIITKLMSTEYGIKTLPILREGNIFTTIGEVIGETGASLVVLGTHGKVGIQQHLTGSFALKVVTTSPAPVIVIQKGTRFDQGYKNIVFPVSTTAEVRQKVKWVVMIAKTFKSKIHLVQLYEPLEESQRKMRTIVSQIMEKFDDEKISYTHFLAKKGQNFGKQVLSYAKENHADMITIMTTPEAINFILGPYDEQMIFNSHEIPVMCVNPVDRTTTHWFGN